MIRRLQTLRFVAAAAVLVGHSLMELAQHNIGRNMLAALGSLPWGMGVDIFFVISGFIIAHASLELPSAPGVTSKFILNRFIRVWPPYAFFTALMLIAVLAVPSFLKHARLDVEHIAASFAFLPWPRPDDGRYYPLLGQGWTLNYEMFFYLSFALTLLLPPRWRAALLCCAGGILVAAGQMWHLPQPLAFYSHPVIAEFIYGVLLSLVFRRVSDQPLWGGGLIALALLYIALVPIDTEVPSRALFAGLPAAMIVGGVLLLGSVGERMMGGSLPVLLGNASYALYLCHTFVVNAVLWIMLRLFNPPPPALFMIVTFISATAASVIFYRLFEQPCLRLLKVRISTRRTRAVAA
ncbi:acyltransferase family protein [Sphingobium sp.]|uniref:acyltransferase family protein n=1 Tax=Sphingobium sp. TaxID=1912891 RepID=UPI003BB5C604